jgi:hypothetical protein
MQKTIYVATSDLWDEIKAMAQSNGGKSISRYLIDLHTDNVLKAIVESERQATITKELELVDSIRNGVDFSA